MWCSKFVVLLFVIILLHGFTAGFHVNPIAKTSRMSTGVSNNRVRLPVQPAHVRVGVGRGSVKMSTAEIKPDGFLTEPSTILWRRSDPVSKLVKNSKYASCYVEDTVATAVQNMVQSGRGGILILNKEDGSLAGIFTERDFVNKIMETKTSSTGTLIGSVMTPASALVTASMDTSINDCRQIMASNGIRRLPIVDENKKPLGLASMSQIVRILQAEDASFGSVQLFGDSLDEVEEQSKVLANELALESGEAGKSQDLLRGGFVAVGAAIGATLLQQQWLHDHEYLAMCGTFLVGYIGIVFETYFEFNKAAIALLMSTALWVIYSDSGSVTGATPEALALLSEKISEVSEVCYFILGAMTIVEIVDAHQGFKVITDRIKARSKRELMWLLAFITFFMSAVLDNLTTTIVMVSLVKKIVDDPEDRKLYGALVVLAANAGGAWTPIGDVTTTMLWINGQISALPTITGLFLPSAASVVASVAMLQTQFDKDATFSDSVRVSAPLAPRGELVFATGLLGLLSVPVFKAFTGLPPYLGMLSALGVLWTLTDAIHAGEDSENRKELMAPAALKKIDTSGVLFFLGILLSVGALDSAGILRSVAQFLDSVVPDQTLIATIIGFTSALIDNVPLVAASMAMYPTSTVAPDSALWQLIAYCAGTGGSMLIIGSAAGVALMGLEKVDFLWYVKRVSLSAVVGYLTGIGVYLIQQNVVSHF